MSDYGFRVMRIDHSRVGTVLSDGTVGEAVEPS